MAKRLPRPAKPIRQRIELDEGEMVLIDIAAGKAGLSVASFLRVIALDAAANADERLVAWKEITARLMLGTGDEPPPKPGRPKKDAK